MKRPEGFDDADAAPAPPPSSRATRGKRAPREEPEREKPVRERPVRRAARPAAPSAERAASAELRAAERARKRHERTELKRFTRRTRRRRLAWLSGLGVVAGLVALVAIAVYSPLLALREIRVEGTERLDPAQLAAAVDGQLGVPLALLDDDRIRDELSAFTLIRSYTTELMPPGTLIVHIAERAPVGSIARGTAFDLVDPAGVVIASTPERPAGVPVIRVASDDVESVAFRSIAEVLLALPPELLATVDTVTASTRDDVTLILTGSDQRVEWGSAERSEHKARVLAALVAVHGGGGPGLYDVTAPGTAVFRAD